MGLAWVTKMETDSEAKHSLHKHPQLPQSLLLLCQHVLKSVAANTLLHSTKHIIKRSGRLLHTVFSVRASLLYLNEGLELVMGHFKKARGQ